MEVFRGCSSVDCIIRGFLPVACAWFSGLSGLLGSCFWSVLPRSSSGCGCFSWPPVLFILRLPGFLGDCSFADVDGGFGSRGAEWMFAFGRSSSSVFTLLPASLMGGSCGGLGACLPFFPLPFPLESLSLHGSWSGFCRGSSLRGVSSCSLLRLACLRSGGGGLRWQSLTGPYVLRDVYLVPVRISPLLLLRYTGRFECPRCACLGLRPFGKCV